MEIAQLTGFTALILISGIIIIMLSPKEKKPIIALLIVLINALLTSIPAVQALSSSVQTGLFSMPLSFGNINLRVDGLSAWFILIINFTSITGILFGKGYLKSYSHLPINSELHWIFYILFHLSMNWVCMFENGIAFLVSWELMSLSSLMLVIFEFQNKDTLKAGLNYLVQMHLSVICLTIGFIWLFFKTNSFNFSALAQLPLDHNSLWIFVLFFIGFAIKAGFIPFHTWLPHAHPCAPSHISGVMSGVIVKLGIYGIFRMITYLRQDWLLMGEILLSLSIITAIYGIANAAVKHDYKKMLAFCTIENIGIIGIGLGIGLIGMGTNNNTMVMLGFSGALIHTLNHSLFKSLLFFGAGSIFQQTHTRNIEQLGGLIKKMPKTALFFLIGSLAIVGLPPFNGFVSEFLIYSGLFNGLTNSLSIAQTILLVLTIAGLAFVGGMAIFTFTKTFGIIFLGNPRKELQHEIKETSNSMLLPLYMIILAILTVAMLPQLFFSNAAKIIEKSFPFYFENNTACTFPIFENMTKIGFASLIFIALLTGIFIIRFLFVRRRETASFETWGCGYVAPVAKAQYSGRSFSRSFGILFNFLVHEHKNNKKIPKSLIYPKRTNYSTSYLDILEKYIINPIARKLTFSLNYFQFIQNGQIQSYVIYGLFFIILVFLISVLNIIN